MFVIKDNRSYGISIPSSNSVKDIIFTDGDTIILNSDLKSIAFLDSNDSIKCVGYIDTDDYMRSSHQPDNVFFDTKRNKIYVSNVIDKKLSLTERNLSDVQCHVYFGLDVSARSIELDPESNKLYVAHTDSISSNSSISIIDVNTNKKLPDKISLNGSFIGMELYPESNKLYVAHTDSISSNSSTDSISSNSSISIIDVNTNKKLPDKISLNGPIRSIELDPESNKLYVAHTDSISIIDVNTNKKLPDKISLNGPIRSMELDPESNKLYVAHTDSISSNSSISIIDVNTNKKLPDKIPIDEVYNYLTIDTKYHKIYWIYFEGNDGYLSILDYTTLDKKKVLIPWIKSDIFGLDKNFSIIPDPNTEKLYLIEKDKMTLLIIDPLKRKSW